MTYDREEVGLMYIHLFPARLDAYSRWMKGIDAEGEPFEGWRPTRTPLTTAICIAGLTKEGPPISGFLIAADSTSHSLALDFDAEDGFDQAMAVGRAMWAATAPAYVEQSGRGAHLWAVLDHATPARSIRRALRYWITQSGLDPEDPKIELRPGSDSIPEGGLGHALRLPLMPHPRTGKRGRLLNPLSGQPLGANLGETLLNIDLIPRDLILDAAMKYVPKPDPRNIPLYFQMPRSQHTDDDDSTASEILRELWGAPNPQPGRATRCPAHDDRNPSLSLTRDDKRAICHSPACILHNNGKGRGTWELRHLAAKHSPLNPAP